MSYLVEKGRVNCSSLPVIVTDGFSFFLHKFDLLDNHVYGSVSSLLSKFGYKLPPSGSFEKRLQKHGNVYEEETVTKEVVCIILPVHLSLS